MPRVSVVIPAYNAERYIRETLDSVLAQTWRDFEVVVVDDGSEDRTREVASGYGGPVRLVEQANAGPSAARNRGVREARGELVAFVDSDDLWAPEKLALQVPLFDPEGRVGLVYCRTQLVDGSGRPIPTPQRPKPAGQVYYRLLEGNVLGTSTAVVRKTCFDRVGGFPEDMVWSEDWHLWLRIARHYEFAFVDRVLVQHRRHVTSLTAQAEKACLGFLEVLERTQRETDDPRALAVARRAERHGLRDYGFLMLGSGKWAAGRRALLRALARWPFDPKALAGVALSLLPSFASRRLAALWRAGRGSTPKQVWAWHPGSSPGCHAQATAWACPPESREACGRRRRMSETPPVSIVVAAYNAAPTLARCIEALQALDYPGCEIIVVDNASTDETRAIAARYPVALLDEPRRGWPAARNRAWHYSKAPLVANIDADCFAEPAWLGELVAALLADPRAGCAVGRTKVEPGTTLAQQCYALDDPFNIEKYVEGTPSARGRACPWGGGNNVLRREVLEAIGGYDAETYTSGADREYHRRMEAETSYRTVYVPGAVIWHAPRGSLREFFRNSAKYAADAVVHARFDPGVAANLDGYIRRNVAALARNLAGLAWRTAKLLVGRETRLRVAQAFFWNAQGLGSIWGTLKGRRRLAARRKET